MITILDAPPMAHHMDVDTIGRSLSTWRFSFTLSEAPSQFHLCKKQGPVLPRGAWLYRRFQWKRQLLFTRRLLVWWIQVVDSWAVKTTNSFHHLLCFRAAAVSTSEDKIVSKNDETKGSEERKDKNWPSNGNWCVHRWDGKKKKYNDDLILNINLPLSAEVQL